MLSKTDKENLSDLGILKKAMVTKEEQVKFSNTMPADLPGDVYKNEMSERYWRLLDIPEPDVLAVRVLTHIASNVRTIKGCAVFFVALSLLSLAVSIVAALA